MESRSESTASAFKVRWSCLARSLAISAKRCRTCGQARVQLDQFAGLRVLQRDDADIRQHLLTGVLDRHGDEVVTAIRLAKSAAQISYRLRGLLAGLEVGQAGKRSRAG